MSATRSKRSAASSTDGDVLKELRRKLGRWLKSRREERGLTQADLALELNLRYYSFVSQVENGIGRIPQDLYAPWADALQVEAEEFGWTVLSHLEPGLFKMISGREPSEVSPAP